MGFVKRMQQEIVEQEMNERFDRLEKQWFEAYGEDMDGEMIEDLEWALDKDD